jgi:hypothetical protein
LLRCSGIAPDVTDELNRQQTIRRNAAIGSLPIAALIRRGADYFRPLPFAAGAEAFAAGAAALAAGAGRCDPSGFGVPVASGADAFAAGAAVPVPAGFVAVVALTGGATGAVPAGVPAATFAASPPRYFASSA